MGRRKKQADIEEAIEDTKPGPGHNGGPVVELTDDQKRALFFIHKKAYEGSLAAKKAADADLKNVCKLAKSECGKGVVGEIKDAIRLEQPGGSEELQAEIAAKHRVARWMALPVGAEPTMFDSRVPAVDRAYQEGKTIGLAGDPCKPGYAPDLPQYRRYMEGFHDGQAVLAKGGFRKLADIATDIVGADVSDQPFAPPTEMPVAPAAP